MHIRDVCAPAAQAVGPSLRKTVRAMKDRSVSALRWGFGCVVLLLLCGCSRTASPPASGPVASSESRTAQAALHDSPFEAGAVRIKAAGVGATDEPRRLIAWPALRLAPPSDVAREAGGALLATHGEPLPSARLVGCRAEPCDHEPLATRGCPQRRAEIPQHLWPCGLPAAALGSADERENRATAGDPESPAPAEASSHAAAADTAPSGKEQAPHLQAGKTDGTPAPVVQSQPWNLEQLTPAGLPDDEGPRFPPSAAAAALGPALPDQVPQPARAEEPPLPHLDETTLSGTDEPASIDPEEAEPLSSNLEPATKRHPAMDAVAGQAAQHVRKGWSLASRGAVYSARAEFLKALRLLAEALDVQEGGRAHSTALAAGLKALQEAEDFAPRGTARIDVPSRVRSHGTPVLHGLALDDIQPLAAMTRYHTYAQEQLASVAPGEPVASWALFGLGKLYTLLAQQTPPVAAAEAKAMVFHQAALATCPDHALAANELAVLWARMGRYDTACALLQSAAERAANANIWHNLAVVQAQLGQQELARQAAAEAGRLARRAGTRTSASGAVDWVSPEVFAGTARPPAELQAPETARASSAGRSARGLGGRAWGRSTGETPTR